MSSNGRTAAHPVKIRVLGDFQVTVGARSATPTAPKLRQILAVLAVRCNEIVHVDALIDELWGTRPPKSAVAALHTHVYELRRELFAGHRGDTERFLQTRQHGYVAELRPEDIDMVVFESQVADGAAALADADPELARERLAGALSLYRGRALANVRCGELLTRHVTRLQEGRLRALELRLDADFQLGRHHELIGELKAIIADEPFHEGFYEKLMLALHRAGRRNEALDVYQHLRRRLVEELGIEPGPEIQRLQHALVCADPLLDRAPKAATAMLLRGPARPAQLPRDVPDFTARGEALRLGIKRLTTHHPTAVPILAIRGMPGVGKTTTAVHLAHLVRETFPDGQFFACLGGSAEVPEDASEVAAVFLRACGMAPGEVPNSAAERTAAFRSWSADRSALVVLDDAASLEQVQALLPGGPACAVIITSRVPLYGLSGLELVDLHPFGVPEGLELLHRLVGRRRLAAEQAAAAGIVRAVGGLPLAVRLIGQRLAAVPAMKLGACLATVTDAIGGRRLSELSTIGLDLYTRLEASYRKLGDADQRAFRLLAAYRQAEFTADDVAKLFRMDTGSAELSLMRLADAHFVKVLGGDASEGQRYALLELMRRFSLECLMADSPQWQPTVPRVPVA